MQQLKSKKEKNISKLFIHVHNFPTLKTENYCLRVLALFGLKSKIVKSTFCFSS